MSTTLLTRAKSLEEAVILPQLVHDTSNMARAWFLRTTGFDPETWNVQLLSAPTPSSTAATGLNLATSGATETYWQSLLAYQPRTPLGQRLWNIRARIIASGERLLTWEEIDHELAERRGEKENSKE
jgi:hypothetical protein